MEYTKEEFNKVTIQTLKSRGDHISLNAVKMIEEMQEQAINYTHCCTEFADGKCKPMVNADWTYLRCECGKRFEPKG